MAIFNLVALFTPVGAILDFPFLRAGNRAAIAGGLSGFKIVYEKIKVIGINLLGR